MKTEYRRVALAELGCNLGLLQVDGQVTAISQLDEIR